MSSKSIEYPQCDASSSFLSKLLPTSCPHLSLSLLRNTEAKEDAGSEGRRYQWSQRGLGR